MLPKTKARLHTIARNIHSQMCTMYALKQQHSVLTSTVSSMLYDKNLKPELVLQDIDALNCSIVSMLSHTQQLIIDYKDFIQQK